MYGKEEKKLKDTSSQWKQKKMIREEISLKIQEDKTKILLFLSYTG